jgi:peptide/nickel transport system permease protein
MNGDGGKWDTQLMLGIGLLVLIIGTGLLAPWLAPNDPLALDLSNRLQAPNWDYPLGTDHLGRCLLSRLIYGIQTTTASALVIIVLTLVISLPIGLYTGYRRGRGDRILMRLVDGVLAFPDIILAIAITGMLGPGWFNMLLAIIMVRWANYVRLIRSLVLKVCTEDYILSARITGNSHYRIMGRHIFPQIISPVLIFGALDMGKVVILIAGLSFIGLGSQPPTPEWGAMLYDATAYFQLAPHVMIFPGIAIMLFVLSCQWISGRLRELNDRVQKGV